MTALPSSSYFSSAGAYAPYKYRNPLRVHPAPVLNAGVGGGDGDGDGEGKYSVYAALHHISVRKGFATFLTPLAGFSYTRKEQEIGKLGQYSHTCQVAS